MLQVVKGKAEFGKIIENIDLEHDLDEAAGTRDSRTCCASMAFLVFKKQDGLTPAGQVRPRAIYRHAVSGAQDDGRSWAATRRDVMVLRRPLPDRGRRLALRRHAEPAPALLHDPAAVRVPASGGDTVWCNMPAAYAGLSAGMAGISGRPDLRAQHGETRRSSI